MTIWDPPNYRMKQTPSRSQSWHQWRKTGDISIQLCWSRTPCTLEEPNSPPLDKEKVKMLGRTSEGSCQQAPQLRWNNFLPKHYLLLFCQTIKNSKISQSITLFIFEQLKKDCNLTDPPLFLVTIDWITADYTCSVFITCVACKDLKQQPIYLDRKI